MADSEADARERRVAAALPLLGDTASDSERLAGLLIVGRLAPSLDAPTLNRVFAALSGTFLDRLLASPQTEHGAVAVAVLASLSWGSPDVAQSTEFAARLPAVARYAQRTRQAGQDESKAPDDAEDLKRLFTAAAATAAGRQRLCSDDACSSFVISMGLDASWLGVLLAIVEDPAAESLVASKREGLIAALRQCIAAADKQNDNTKFSLVDSCTRLFWVLQPQSLEELGSTAVTHLRNMLRSLLLSRLGEEQRSDALRLAGAVIGGPIGIQLIPDGDASFGLGAFQLATVEVRILLEVEHYPRERATRMLPPAIDIFIAFLRALAEEQISRLSVNNDQMEAIQRGIDATVGAILDAVTEDHSERKSGGNAEGLPAAASCMRALAAYGAVETGFDDRRAAAITRAYPAILDASNSDPQVAAMFAPFFDNMTADERLCDPFVEQAGHRMLLRSATDCIARSSSLPIPEPATIQFLSALLNIVVSPPDAAFQNGDVVNAAVKLVDALGPLENAAGRHGGGWVDVYIYAVAIVVFGLRLRLDTQEVQSSTFRNNELAHFLANALAFAWQQINGKPLSELAELFWVLINATASLLPRWTGASDIIGKSSVTSALRSSYDKLQTEDKKSVDAFLLALR